MLATNSDVIIQGNTQGTHKDHVNIPTTINCILNIMS